MEIETKLSLILIAVCIVIELLIILSIPAVQSIYLHSLNPNNLTILIAVFLSIPVFIGIDGLVLIWRSCF